MRKLASIQAIRELRPIEHADMIELVFIMGWQCVAKKGEFKAGDLCVYFEVDAFLPDGDLRYEFLRGNSYRNNEFMGAGFRIKTMSMRGQISQGLALPICLFDEEFKEIEISEGLDVTEILSVRKWEIPEMAGSAGTQIGEKPYGIPTTDETRIQSAPEYIDAFKGKPYYISTKMDGTSCTVYAKDGKVGVCGRNFEYKEEVDKCPMWKFVVESGLKERLTEYGENLVLQGEFCGEGIQKNRMRLNKPNLFIFDAGLILKTGGVKKYGLSEMLDICEKFKLDTVPIEETAASFDYTLDEILERARGKYDSGLDKEGIVVRTQDMSCGEFSADKSDGGMISIVRRMSFKVINNDFLKKEKG